MRSVNTRLMHPRNLDILVVDNRAIVRDGLAQALHGTDLARTLDRVGTLRDAEPMLRPRHYDLAIIQLGSQRDADLLAGVMRRIRARRPRFLLFCSHGSEQHALPLIGEGVEGCINESCAPDQVLTALRAIASGQKHFGPQMGAMIAESALAATPQTPTQLLSPQELTVLDLLGQGYRACEIASRMQLSIATVNTYKARIKRKTGTRNAPDMLRLAIERRNDAR